MFSFLKRQKSSPVKIPTFLACPYCDRTKWYEGPSGGMSTNIMCVRCEHWFNYGNYIFDVKLHTLTRLNSFVAGTSGKRLTYKALVA